MNTLLFLILFASVILSYLGCCYADKKYDMSLVDWMNGKVANPFLKPAQPSAKASKTQLEARVEVLEKIVCDKRYELDEQLRQLK